MRTIWLFSISLLFTLGTAVGDEPTSKPSTGIAEGSAVDEKEAPNDAFRQAVQQVVGLMVDAETLIENDALIRDKVLTYSGGYIVDYKELSQTKLDGITKIRIRAEVIRQALTQRLEAAEITVKKVSGESMFAEAVTKSNANESAEQLNQKALVNFPHGVLQAKSSPRPTIVSKTSSDAKLRLMVAVSPEATRFQAFAKQLTEILDRAAAEKGSFVAKYKFAAADASKGVYG
jgi:hypothetical protein